MTGYSEITVRTISDETNRIPPKSVSVTQKTGSSLPPNPYRSSPQIFATFPISSWQNSFVDSIPFQFISSTLAIFINAYQIPYQMTGYTHITVRTISEQTDQIPPKNTSTS
jgi:hypothetical protein